MEGDESGRWRREHRARPDEPESERNEAAFQ